MWDFVCSFESGVSFLQSSSSPVYKPHWLSKPDVLGTHLPSAGPPGWGAQYGSQTLHSLGRTSAIVIILPFVGRLPGGVGIDYTAFHLSAHLIVVLYIFSCGKAFLLVFGSFSLIVVL